MTLLCSVESEFSLELQGRPKRLIRGEGCSDICVSWRKDGVRQVSGRFRILMCMGIRYCLDW